MKINHSFQINSLLKMIILYPELSFPLTLHKIVFQEVWGGDHFFVQSYCRSANVGFKTEMIWQLLTLVPRH